MLLPEQRRKQKAEILWKFYFFFFWKGVSVQILFHTNFHSFSNSCEFHSYFHRILLYLRIISLVNHLFHIINYYSILFLIMMKFYDHFIPRLSNVNNFTQICLILFMVSRESKTVMTHCRHEINIYRTNEMLCHIYISFQ